MSSKTQVRGTEDVCISPSDKERGHWKEYLRSRSASGNSPSYGSFSFTSESSDSVQSNKECSLDGYSIMSSSYPDEFDDDEDHGLGSEESNFHTLMHNSDSGVGSARRGRRQRCESECSVNDVSIGSFFFFFFF